VIQLERPDRLERVVRVRGVDLRAVLRLSLILYICLFAVALLFGVGLWAVGRATGAVGDFEHFMFNLGYKEFHVLDAKIFVTIVLAGTILVVMAALATVAVGALFNLVCRRTGGVEVTVRDPAG
jgi:Mn2+/Fe2+ NRAMP family transporter